MYCVQILARLMCRFEHVLCAEMVKQRKVDNDLMQKDTTCTKYPQGMRAFKACPTEGELDQVWSKCVDEDVSINITLKKGCTRRMAMELLHHQMIKEHKASLRRVQSISYPASPLLRGSKRLRR